MRKLFLFLLTAVLVLACKKAPEEVAVTSVTLNQPTAEMLEGETVQLMAVVKPDNATDKKVLWASSKKSVATVSDSGLVTAVAEGSTTITASAGGKTASCQITVNKKTIAVTAIILNEETLSLTEGEEATLTATVKPDNATDKTVTWSSSAPDIAKVENGKVTALKEGSATITAKAGEKSATCQVTVAKKVIPVESVTLDKTSLALTEGDVATLTATVKPDDATDKTVSWSSSAPDIAKVENGKVTALKEGSATITAKAGEKSATCQVTVAKKVIPVESVTLDKTSLALTEGDEATLTATVKPDNATDKTVIWSSSAPDVAKVENGKVTALKEGSATITAKAGEKSATCKITVAKKVIPVESVTLDKTSLAMTEGDVATLTATVKPDDATDKTVSWSSSAPDIAKVENGKVTALKEGSATITAKAGEKSATCQVTVAKKVIPVESVTLDKTSLALTEGDEAALTATVKPDNATDKTVTWSSSAPDIAKVENGKVTALKEGSATITAKAGDKSATCQVTVAKKVIAVESVTLDKTSLALTEGDEATLTATVKPDNATDKTVTWSSSAPDIAKVENGKVTALKEGTATITAKAGDKSATCQVTVAKKIIAVESVTLDKTSLALTEGDEATLTATVKPDNATDKTVTWSSSASDVAKVENGKVTALKEGTATITAKAGDKSATCQITVEAAYVPVSSISWDSNYNQNELKVGHWNRYKVVFTPANATEKKVDWIIAGSENAKFHEVSDDWVDVEGVSSGSFVLKASCNGQTITREITVTPRVSSISINDYNPEYHESPQKLHLVLGASYTIQKLSVSLIYDQDTPVQQFKWTSDNSSKVSVNSSGVITALGTSFSGSTVNAVRVWVSAVECPSVKAYVDVYVHSVPTEVIIKDDDLGETVNGINDYFKPGETHTVRATIKPATAWQTIFLGSTQYSTVCGNWLYEWNNDNSLDVTAPSWKSGANEGQFYSSNCYYYLRTANQSGGTSVQAKLNLRLCMWNKSDVKPLDYVYYNSSSGKLRSSDGGLRAVWKGSGDGFEYTKEDVSPAAQSNEKCVALVMYLGSIPDAKASNMQRGLSNASGKHGFARAISNAPLNSADTFKWSDDNDNVDSSDNWKGGSTYQTHWNTSVNEPDWRYAFGLTYYAAYYNNKRGDSHDIKPMKALLKYAETHPVGAPGGDYASYNNTYWVLPTYAMGGYPVVTNNNWYHFKYWQPLFDKNGQKAGGAVNCTSWTISTYDAYNAYDENGKYVFKTRAERGLVPWLIF